MRCYILAPLNMMSIQIYIKKQLKDPFHDPMVEDIKEMLDSLKLVEVPESAMKEV